MIRSFGKLLIVTILPLFIMAFSFGGNNPSESELKNSLSQKIPSFAKITNFTIEALQNQGTEVDPKYRSRFKATIEASDNLYTPDKKENGALFVLLKTNKGKTTDIFGKTTSILYEGAWKHAIEIDGNTISNIGIPLNQFSYGKVIIRGSDEEKLFTAEIDKKIKERKDEVERKDAEFRKNLANASKILVGKWRDENSITTYNADGTSLLINDNGTENFRQITIDGDIVTKLLVKSRNNSNSEWKNNGSVYKSKITYIDDNNITWVSILGPDGGASYHMKRVK